MSQTDVVLQGIKAMIVGGQLNAGSQLPIEKDLTAALGVSRGALREGVRALCIMGVLETRRGVGTYVTSLDSRLLLAPMGFMIDLQTPERRHLLQLVRRVLESEAAGRAALTITSHQLMEAAVAVERIRSQVFAAQATDQRAIMEADAAFHRIVAQASGNGVLAALVDALTDKTFTARSRFDMRKAEHARRSYESHAAILDALEQRDPDRARVLMSHHLMEIEHYVLEDQAGAK